MEPVDFVVRGLDDCGYPSDCYIHVTEVLLLDREGGVRGRFRKAATLTAALATKTGEFKLVATETVGLPQIGLKGIFCCHEQAWPDLEPNR